ncbi:uncharacterized protein [Setaria viridis]|uniref:uncharacterized protein n=1 Tax=Setaria viridis TaxID=4556 RepID=UPI003B3A5CD2
MGKHLVRHGFMSDYTKRIYHGEADCGRDKVVRQRIEEYDNDAEKALEARNVCVALATDGFNLYGMVAAPYTCWPMFVIPLNLPPGVLLQRQNIFLSLIIPEHPGNNMSVYMEPLIDDLVHAWEERVWTYDRATRTNFKMHVWYQYSLHDLPAYGIFCGWCVHGKFPYPICKASLKFIWLTKGGKYSSFDKHRQFLPPDHPFRRDNKNFTKDVVVNDLAPQMMTLAAVRAQLDTPEVNNHEDGFVGYGEQHAWTQKSCLWNLPYFDDLLPHHIDAMHTEKNIAKAIFGTIMDIPDKKKDNVKARVDQARLCNRPKLDMVPPSADKSWRKPKADFVLTRAQGREVLEWFQTLMFHDGYAMNLKRGVNLATMRINRLKSQDYHIWLERLLPVMVRGYVPEHVWQVLVELSNFFRQLCAKELSWTVVAEMERIAPVLLCKLEKIFPPGFFNPMQHMILHLPYEARMGGPVQGLVFAEQEDPAYTWDHYVAAADVDDRDHRTFANKAERVKAELWDFYRCQEGFEARAASVTEQASKKLVKDMHYEAWVQAIIDFYDEFRKMKVTKEEARTMNLTKEEFMVVDTER